MFSKMGISQVLVFIQQVLVFACWYHSILDWIFRLVWQPLNIGGLVHHFHQIVEPLDPLLIDRLKQMFDQGQVVPYHRRHSCLCNQVSV
jgi:hypothetical protein